MNGQQTTQAVPAQAVPTQAAATQAAAAVLGRDDPAALRVLSALWDAAFEEGRLAALDEFQDRFCVCMK